MSRSQPNRRGLPQRVKMRHEPHFVEELAARHSVPVGRMAPLKELEPDPDQPRTSIGDLSDLVGSIRDKGVLEPILVRRVAEVDDPGSPGALRIISGERRYRAALEAGLMEVPVIEMAVGEEEALEIALIENLQRKDLTPFEEAEGYNALRERHGYTHQQISSAVGKSRSAVTESLSLLQMPPRARDAAMALGIASKSVLLEVLKRCDSDQEMIVLLEQVAEGGLNRDQIRAQSAGPARKRRGPSSRRRPYTFRFRAPDRTFKLSLSFRKAEVDRADLIGALESILGQLREEQEADGSG